MGEILFALGVVAFVVLWVVSSRSMSRKAKRRVEVIRRAGQTLGFDYSVDEVLKNLPTIRGTHDQIWFEVKLRYTDAESDSVYLQYEMTCAIPVPEMTMRARTASSRMAGKARSELRVATGDEHFDKQVIATSADEEALLRFLTASRQRFVLDLLDEWKRVKVTSDSIVVESSIPIDSQEIVRQVERLASLTKAFAT